MADTSQLLQVVVDNFPRYIEPVESGIFMIVDGEPKFNKCDPPDTGFASRRGLNNRNFQYNLMTEFMAFHIAESLTEGLDSGYLFCSNTSLITQLPSDDRLYYVSNTFDLLPWTLSQPFSISSDVTTVTNNGTEPGWPYIAIAPACNITITGGETYSFLNPSNMFIGGDTTRDITITRNDATGDAPLTITFFRA